MRFHVVSLFPGLIESYFQEGLVGQARTQGKISLNILNPRAFTSDIHHTVDDRPFGGGDGMVMQGAPLEKAVKEIQANHSSGTVIYLSPQGQRLSHSKVMQLSEQSDLTLICGRYAGVDQRFINQYVDEELSIGDYVLSGGEAAAIVLIDAISRQLEGVLGHASSAKEDSFAVAEGLLEPPLFTRPQHFAGQGVPGFLLSGNHKLLSEAKRHLSLLVTAKKRPDLLDAGLAVDLQKARRWLRSLPDQEQIWLGFNDGEL